MKRRAAVFTIVQNEPVFLPVWARYYSKHFNIDDVFVLDHASTDPVTTSIARQLNRVPVHRAESFNHAWLRDTVKHFQQFLLDSYEVVLFAEADEIVATNPELCPGGLAELLDDGFGVDTPFIRCTGYEIVHDQRREAPMDWSQPIIAQRERCRRSVYYSKPLLARCVVEWGLGFHRTVPGAGPLPDPDPRLLLLHLHRADFETCRMKTLENASRRWSATDLSTGAGAHNRIVDQSEFEQWFETEFFDNLYTLQSIPGSWRGIV